MGVCPDTTSQAEINHWPVRSMDSGKGLCLIVNVSISAVKFGRTLFKINIVKKKLETLVGVLP